jgi:hypothetical protein
MRRFALCLTTALLFALVLALPADARIPHGSVSNLGSMVTVGTLSTGTAAARRTTLGASKMALYHDGATDDVVYFELGDSTVDCTDNTDADGLVGPKQTMFLDSNIGGNTHISFCSASDVPSVYLWEVE